MLRAGIGGDIANNDHRFTLSSEVSKLMARTKEYIVDGDTSYISMGPFESLYKSWDAVKVPDTKGGTTKLSLAEQFVLGAGLEYSFREQFFARTGYYYENPANGDRQYGSFRAGLQVLGLSFDVSYLVAKSMNPVDGTLRFSLSYNFGGTDNLLQMPVKK